MEFNDEKIVKKVWICEREYNISMLTSEEQAFDTVIKFIQEKVLELRTKFPKLDSQDLLFMCMIQLVTKDIEGAKTLNELEEIGRVDAIITAIEGSLMPSTVPNDSEN